MAWLARSKQKTKEAKAPATHHRPAAPVTSVSPEVDRRAIEIGRELLKAAREYRGSVFSLMSDKLMNWAMKDPVFKLQLFRFIDVFPMLKTADQVHDCLTEYLSQPGVTLPPGMSFGLKAGKMAKGIMAKTIATGITTMAQNFISGVDAASALPNLKKQWTEGVAFSVDLLGEACVSEREAVEYQRRYLDLVETLRGMVTQ
jgi:RHH-type proline utilization regulon transcriptional repressor/proline dehydrogenase/delta 1-pyrroline-5-carboxylate dehydrogenase